MKILLFGGATLLGLGLLAAPTQDGRREPPASLKQGAKQNPGGAKGGPNQEKNASQGGAKKGLTRAELEQLRRKQIAKQQEQHFYVCDLDRRGYISFREAEATLGLDREGFQRYDKDKDGRIYPDEFRARYQEILNRLGVVAPPTPDPDAHPIEAELTPIELPVQPEPNPSSQELLDAYDMNRNGGLGRSELDRLFQDLAFDLTVELFTAEVDRNQSGQLELEELRRLAVLVSTRLAEIFQPHELEEPEIFLDLYRRSLPRRQAEGAPPLPPRIPGPVSNFRRLDLDDDGFISAEDLRALTSPARLGLRPTAILSGADQNGDGKLSEAEFVSSLQGR